MMAALSRPTPRLMDGSPDMAVATKTKKEDSLLETVKTIFKRLFRVYAHIYHSHFKDVCALGEEAHLNTCFKHFMYFTEVWPSSIYEHI